MGSTVVGSGWRPEVDLQWLSFHAHIILVRKRYNPCGIESQVYCVSSVLSLQVVFLQFLVLGTKLKQFSATVNHSSFCFFLHCPLSLSVYCKWRGDTVSLRWAVMKGFVIKRGNFVLKKTLRDVSGDNEDNKKKDLIKQKLVQWRKGHLDIVLRKTWKKYQHVQSVMIW